MLSIKSVCQLCLVVAGSQALTRQLLRSSVGLVNLSHMTENPDLNLILPQ